MTTESIEISTIPTNNIPLSQDEQNIFNMIFAKSVPSSQIEPIKKEEQKTVKETKVMTKSFSFIKKLLLAIILASVILIHAITPLSILLKGLTSNVSGLVVVVTYIVLCYFAVDSII